MPARVGLAMATMADSRVILDQNGAEELTPPGQAILVRGVETLKVMSPYLPDDERAQRLARLREGEQELTDFERRVLEAENGIMQEGKKLTLRALYDQVGGKYARVNAAYKHFALALVHPFAQRRMGRLRVTVPTIQHRLPGLPTRFVLGAQVRHIGGFDI